MKSRMALIYQPLTFQLTPVDYTINCSAAQLSKTTAEKKYMKTCLETDSKEHEKHNKKKGVK